MPRKENVRVDLFPYEEAILALRERDYSYSEIAAWLSKEINVPVKRGQVYYVCQQLAADAQEEFAVAARQKTPEEFPTRELGRDEPARAVQEEAQVVRRE